MKVSQYKRLNKILFSALILIVIFSVWSGSFFFSFLGLLTYMLIISLFKTRVEGVLADERQEKVSSKAAQLSFKILLPMLALASVAMISSGGNKRFYYVEALGIVLSYVTVLAFIFYRLTYWYFDKKTGGR